MKKTTIKSAIIIFAISVLIFNSCEKEKNNYSILSAQDNAFANNIFDDVYSQVDEASKSTDSELFDSSSFKMTDTGGCVTISITPFDISTWPKYLTIDYGNSNCLCTDLNYRRGKIVAELSDRYRNVGATHIITFDDYYVNDNHVEGTKTIINNGENQDGNLYFTVIVSNAKITKVDSSVILWEADRIREWINGESTILWIWDDEYLVSGISSGTNTNNEEFTITITQDLDIILSCTWIRSGSLNIDVDNGTPTIFVDYGTGDCDANATAIIDGNSYSFIMN